MKKDKSIVYDKTGDIAGLWTIDGNKVREVFGTSRYWEGIDEIVRLFKELNPAEFEASVRENVITRTNNLNQFGSNQSGSTRLAIQIPHSLYLPLMDYDNRLFRDKKKREAFMKRFNALRACDEV